jgi:hypothetical protein
VVAAEPQANESAEAREERRRTRRRRLFKGATISLNGLHTAIDCVIRDLSDAGARLGVENPVGVPDVFYLVVRGELVRKSRVVWRSARMIGVVFEADALNQPWSG